MSEKNQRDKTEIEYLLGYANGIIATLREPFLVLDKNLRVIFANHAFYSTFEVAEKDTIGQRLPDLGDRQWNIPKLIQLLKEIIPEKKVVKNYEVEHKFERIGERFMILNATQLRVPKKVAATIAPGAEDEEEDLILLAIEDITERKKAAAEMRELDTRLRLVLEAGHMGVWDIDTANQTVVHSSEHDRIFGYTEPLSQWNYKLFMEHVLPEDRERVDIAFQSAVKNKASWISECRIRRADGLLRWILIIGRLQRDAEGKMRRMAGIVQDITERKLADVEKQRRLEELEVFYKASVGREERILELKKEVELLRSEKSDRS